jgi:hypothetical protein
LHANESVRVEGNDKNHRIVRVSTFTPSNFVREIPKRTIKVLDLVDVVAGGDGFSSRRNRGIDPATGRISTAQPSQPHLTGDYKYHRIKEIPFVDGVFIPDGSAGAVQVDSAGHTFDDFFKTDNVGYGHIWAGEPVAYVGSSKLGGIDYASAGHGALFLHASKGITFDLEAIRRANPGCKLLRFLATAGNTETDSLKNGGARYADLRVLVDGKSRFCRREIDGLSGAFSVAVPIDDKDCFLTLAATDGGNGIESDQIMFGDPRLELAPAKSQHESCIGSQ